MSMNVERKSGNHFNVKNLQRNSNFIEIVNITTDIHYSNNKYIHIFVSIRRMF